MRKGGWPLLRGEPVARQCQRFFAGPRPALRRGGNPPAPAFPGGETGKGRYRIFNQSGGDRLSLQLGGHFIVATTCFSRRDLASVIPGRSLLILILM